MTEELKELIESQSKAVDFLRLSIEKNETLSQETLEKIKADFLTGEEANKEIQAKVEAQEEKINTQEEKAKAQEETIKTLEKKAYRIPAGQEEDLEKKAQSDAFERYIMESPREEKRFELDDMERKYLRTDLAADGGVLVPETLFPELIKLEIETSPVLANARVITSKAKSMSIAIRNTTIPTTNRPGEGGTSATSNSKYQKVRLEAYRNDVIIPITREELNFTAFDMRQQMTEDAALSLTEQTNVDFLNGNGVSKSEGIMVNSDVTSVNSGIANDIKMDNFLTMQKKDNIKSVYRTNGKFYMNANTLFDLLAKKTGDGQYLWNQNIALGLPNTLAGKSYIDFPDMPDTGANNFPVFFGDLKKAYYILRAIGVELVIDPYTAKSEGMIEYLWIEFLGGKVVVPEAIVKLKCSV